MVFRKTVLFARDNAVGHRPRCWIENTNYTAALGTSSVVNSKRRINTVFGESRVSPRDLIRAFFYGPLLRIKPFLLSQRKVFFLPSR